jgi:hypothetical protein
MKPFRFMKVFSILHLFIPFRLAFRVPSAYRFCMKPSASLMIMGVTVMLLSCSDAEKSKDKKSTTHACDSTRFLEIATAVEDLRERNRLSAADFAEAAKDPDTIILDARGREFYERLHVMGAVNLPYTHFTRFSLEELIPDRSTRILIYCRNNLKNAPEGFPVPPATPEAFELRVIDGRELEVPTEYEPPELPKLAEAGLNIPTFIALHSYGYNNVWELDEIVDPKLTPIKFASGKPQRLENRINE